MSSPVEDWVTVPGKKNNKAQRDAAKAESAAAKAEAAKQLALKQQVEQRPVPKNKGTVLCRNFVSPEGCKRGDLCNFRHSVDPPSAALPSGTSADNSSWRRGTGGSVGKPSAGGDDSEEIVAGVGNATIGDRFHQFLSPAMRDRVERAGKMAVPQEYLSSLPDIDFTPNPLEKVVLSYLYSNAVTPMFEATFQQADSNFVNIQVACHLQFPESVAKPSLIDFSPQQINELASFILNESYVKDIAGLGGIFTWAEGSFRQKTIPQYHGNLRLCKFKLLESDPSTRTGLLEAMLHTYEYTLAEMYYDYHTAEIPSDLGQTTFLNVRRRLTPAGQPSDVYLVRRQVDGMQLGLWDSMKSYHFNTLWYPYNRAGFRKSVGSPGSWYKLETEDHPNDDRYFYLLGFDDRESKKLFPNESVEDRANAKNAKFIRFVEENSPMNDNKKHGNANVKRRIKATKNRSEATKFFQETNDGILYVVSGQGETVSKQLVKCPLVRKRGLDEADTSGNPYFKEDLEALSKLPLDSSLWNHQGDVGLSMEELRSFVLIHPFLPIVAFKRPVFETKEEVCLETLNRLQLLLKGLRNVDNCECPDCEVILYLANLRSEGSTECITATTLTGRAISTGIPGFNSDDFSPEWKEVVAYTWLLPSIFYQSGLLSSDKLATWFKNFEEKGEKFKVVS